MHIGFSSSLWWTKSIWRRHSVSIQSITATISITLGIGSSRATFATWHHNLKKKESAQKLSIRVMSRINKLFWWNIGGIITTPCATCLSIVKRSRTFSNWFWWLVNYLFRLATRDAPFGDDRPAAARSDDDIALAGDGRQSDDAVESEETDAHPVQVATCASPANKLVDDLFDRVIA